MAEVSIVPGLDARVADLSRDYVDDLTGKVAARARRTAPAVKRWVTMHDGRVRDPYHTAADGQERPENLKFDLQSHPWDMGVGRVGPPRYIDPVHQLGSVGPRTFLDHPGQKWYGVWVNIVHCRCFTTRDFNGIARKVRRTRARVIGNKATAEAYVRAPFIIEAELGDLYPEPFGHAEGTHFMRNAARHVAAASHTSR